MGKVHSDKEKKSIAQQMVGWLFRENDLSLGFSGWMKLLSATLIIRNRKFSQEFFEALSKKISSSFADPDLSDLKKDLILYNALSYIPFSDPQEGQVLTIKGIEYSIQRIALTSGWLSSTYYAYGLKATTDKNAQSILIFQGTTTPADHGFLAGVMADTRPVGAVGTQLYARGKEKLQNWINTESIRTQKRVLCTGQSLGGAMSLHAHIHQPDAVDYFVVNPPGLTKREKEIYEKNSAKLPSDDSTRVLNVVSHVNDPVLRLGSLYLPEGTKIYRHGKKRENNIIAHAKAPDCSKKAADLPFVIHDNSKRTKSYSWKIIKSFLFAAVLILHALALPIRVVIKMARVLTSSHQHGTKSRAQNSADTSRANEGSTDVEAQTRPTVFPKRSVVSLVDVKPGSHSASLNFFGSSQEQLSGSATLVLNDGGSGLKKN